MAVVGSFTRKGTAVPEGAQTVAAALLLMVALAVAVLRPRGLPEAVGAVPTAAVAVVVGLLPARQALDELGTLAPTVGFLAAVLVLARLCELEGLFVAAGDRMAQASHGRPVALLGLVFAVCSVVTAVLSLDTTVVLLTPVVFVTATSLRLRTRPYVYACVHLSNSASLLLPVSNLTNLLAFHASGLTFLTFAALMTLPWLIAIAAEYLVLRRFFAADLGGHAVQAPPPRPLPAYPVVVILATLVAFALTSVLHFDPALAAAGGAVALGAPALIRHRATLRDVSSAVNVPFLAFVFGLGVTVKTLQVHGLDRLGRLVPSGSSLLTLLAIAGIAAVAANLINNLPAILVLLPAVTGHPGPVLAAVIGVNIGPNLTYVGSLATLLWRRILHARGEQLDPQEFLRVGALSVPLALVASTGALWASLRLLGKG